MDSLNGILDIGKEEEVKMIIDRLIDGKELLVDLLVFLKKLIKKEKDSKKIRQILLHWCYKLTLS